MASVFLALTPVLSLIAIGYGIKRGGLLADGAWSGLEKLAYFILFPALLVNNLAGLPLSDVDWGRMLLVVVPTCLAASIILVTWHLLRGSVSGPTFTSIFQGGVRFNSYVSLAIADAYFGAAGLAICAVAASTMIVTVNLLSVVVHAIWGSRAGTFKYSRLVKDIVGNPLILSAGAGLLIGANNIVLPEVIMHTLGLIARAALPVGLLAVGAGISLSAIGGHMKPVVIATVVQYGVKPMIAVLLIAQTGMTGVAAGAVFVIFITPVASSSFILSRQMGGDAAVVTSIITVQTVLAFAYMPLALAWFQSLA